MLDALEPVLERLTHGKEPDDPLLRGPRGGVLTTATVRDATHWEDLVKALGFGNLTRHGPRHTGATWMADAGIALHVLQEILGHQSIETTKGYLHPDRRHLAEAARQANQFLSAGFWSTPRAPSGALHAQRRRPGLVHFSSGRLEPIEPVDQPVTTSRYDEALVKVASHQGFLSG